MSPPQPQLRKDSIGAAEWYGRMKVVVLLHVQKPRLTLWPLVQDTALDEPRHVSDAFVARAPYNGASPDMPQV